MTNGNITKLEEIANDLKAISIVISDVFNSISKNGVSLSNADYIDGFFLHSIDRYSEVIQDIIKFEQKKSLQCTTALKAQHNLIQY